MRTVTLSLTRKLKTSDGWSISKVCSIDPHQTTHQIFCQPGRICCKPPAREEIAKATKQLHANKAAGPDVMPPEALKIDIDVSKDILYDLFVKIWKEEQFPKDWKEGQLVKLPKKGDLGNSNKRDNTSFNPR